MFLDLLLDVDVERRLREDDPDSLLRALDDFVDLWLLELRGGVREGGERDGERVSLLKSSEGESGGLPWQSWVIVIM